MPVFPEIRSLKPADFPLQLRSIPDPPKKLSICGNLPDWREYHYLTVVGSREYSDYGQKITEYLINGLRGYPIAIVSGLARGIDAIAHRAALDVGLPTIALPGSGLSPKVIYPARHLDLASRISQNGCLLSEFELEEPAYPYNFPKRNRLMAAMSQAVLIIEAEKISGTSITARLALDYNRDVLAVPGSIFSSRSHGPNYLIKQGATPILSAGDILEALGIEDCSKLNPADQNGRINMSLFVNVDLNEDEQDILNLLSSPRTRTELENSLPGNPAKLSRTLVSLELKSLICIRGDIISINTS